MAAAQIKGSSAASHSSHMLSLLMLHALPLNQRPNDGGNELDGGDPLESDSPLTCTPSEFCYNLSRSM